jgi:beta-glucosidase-like glycosyl hydrolase
MAPGDGTRLSARPPAARRRFVVELLAGMTAAEKIGQLVGVTLGRSGAAGIAAGVVAGSGPGLVAITPRPLGEMTRQAAEAQARIAASARLRIPALVFSTGDPTDLPPFPVPLARAATWNTELVGRVAATSAATLAAAGLHATLTPAAGPALLSAGPGGDRAAGEELAGSLGDDPVLAADILRAHVIGLQGLPAARFGAGQVAAALPGVGDVAARPATAGDQGWSARYLRSTVWPPAEAGVRAGAGLVVPATVVNDGVPPHADSHVLQDVLRDAWGFDGVVVAGLADVAALAAHHHVTDGLDAALALAVESGVQVVVAPANGGSGASNGPGDDGGTHRRLTRLLTEGRLSPWLVDAAVTQVLLLKAALGLLDDAPPRPAVRAAGSAARYPLAATVGAESLVLLTDPRGVLPLHAAGPLLVTAAGSVRETAAVRALAAALGARHRGGAGTLGDDTADVGRAGAVVVVVDEADGPDPAAGTLGRMVASGVPCVALVCGGDPRAVGPLVATTSAVLLCWEPVAGNAATLASVLLGGAEPGGRLPLTIPGAGGTALFPLGHGGGYTGFEYSHLRIGPDRTQEGAQVVVQCRVTNTGERPGKEVVQVHVLDDIASVVSPGSTLAAFAAVTVEPGRSATVTMRVPAARVALWDRAMRHVVEPGTFTVLVGRSAADVRLRGTFSVDATRDLTV